ncbi:MAG: alkylhydroperoxidase [Pseudomonadales bacterium]|nr:alkylhydroperoxidase [Pseudomonadales bacterium]RLU02486.1 MAG: carboxymuconolactone decarboxylase family protein [Ketobacter sp.]
MPRIQPVVTDNTDAKTAATLKAVQSKLGVLPNMFTTLAHAPTVLTGYLQLSETLGQGRLNARQREMVAIAVAQQNHCEYCLSAHAVLGKGAGLTDGDIERARDGVATDELDDAIVQLALRITTSRGGITDEELAVSRQAGLDDGLILEVVGQVALNVLTNYVNRVAGTAVDFPLLKLDSVA